MKTISTIIISLIVALFSSYGYADFVYTKTGYWGEGNKYAISGYDVTSYFTNNEPQKGSSDYPLEYKDAIWLFSSMQNRQLFQDNPQKYAPQYGGHCAWREAQDGKEVYGDPTLWTIVDDKLYLNYNKEINRRWTKDIPKFIKDADKFWLAEFESLN